MAQLYTTFLLLSTDLDTVFYGSWDKPPSTKGYTPSILCKMSHTQQLPLQILVGLRVCISYNQIVGRNRQQVIRPLLGLSRSDATRLCANWNLPVYPDATNEKLQFLRNRLRKQLFPLLRCLFNPRFDKSLFQCSELMAQEQLRIETILVEVAKKRHDHDSNGLSEIDSLVHIVKQCDRVGFSPGTFPKINTLSNVNLSSKQVAKSSHCLFLPKIGCYFLL
jgi:hypothetical protein